jgi:hypothetical protein
MFVGTQAKDPKERIIRLGEILDSENQRLRDQGFVIKTTQIEDLALKSMRMRLRETTE